MQPFSTVLSSIATQLQRGKNMAIDYDQLLAKRPSTSDSIFAWHQDMAYWPPLEDVSSHARQVSPREHRVEDRVLVRGAVRRAGHVAQVLPLWDDLAADESHRGLLHLAHLVLGEDVREVDVPVALEGFDLLGGDDVGVAVDAGHRDD